MVVLKKIKASTLMETMVATVLIVVLFMMASLILNAMLSSTVEKNTLPITEQMNKLEYEYKNGKISSPYVEEWEDWTIAMEIEQLGPSSILRLEAINNKTKRTIRSVIPADGNKIK